MDQNFREMREQEKAVSERSHIPQQPLSLEEEMIVQMKTIEENQHKILNHLTFYTVVMVIAIIVAIVAGCIRTIS